MNTEAREAGASSSPDRALTSPAHLPDSPMGNSNGASQPLGCQPDAPLPAVPGAIHDLHALRPVVEDATGLARVAVTKIAYPDGTTWWGFTGYMPNGRQVHGHGYGETHEAALVDLRKDMEWRPGVATCPTCGRSR